MKEFKRRVESTFNSVDLTNHRSLTETPMQFSDAHIVSSLSLPDHWQLKDYAIARRIFGSYSMDEVRKLLDEPDGIVLATRFDDLPLGGLAYGSCPNVELPSSEVLYQGSYNHQGEDSTCTAWAVINGARVLDSESSDMAQELLRAATKSQTNASGGLKLEDAATVVNNSGGAIEANLVYETSTKTYDRFWSRVITEENIKEHGTIMKDAIDNDGVVVAVKNSPSKHILLSSHSLCIAGYKVDENGRMDVQVLDSDKEYTGRNNLGTLSKTIVDAAQPFLILRKKTV